jgi:glycosyltransferase involved in cell wall biosynthesis
MLGRPFSERDPAVLSRSFVGKLHHSDDKVLLDVTRMVWRAWRGRHPTGIDRVCLAYVDHFKDRALAVVQRRGQFRVLSAPRSRKLFDLLLKGHAVAKADLARVLAIAAFLDRRDPPAGGMTYLNVGHTGLNDRAIAGWIERNRVRAFYLIHDLIPITNPEFCRPQESEKHRERMRNVLETATGVIGNSQVTLDELSEFAAAQGLRMPAQATAWICGFGAGVGVRGKALDRPYFITVGTIEARKNHMMLLRIWKRIVAVAGEEAPILVVVGQPGWEAGEALEVLEDLEDLEGSVFHLQDCDDEELAAWLAGARALLMPSVAEGFGLPIVEALSLGTPVIASDLPVYREIVGTIPTYLQPDDQRAWEAAITSFMKDGSERGRQQRQIPGYRQPNWQEHFAVVEDWLGGF